MVRYGSLLLLVALLTGCGFATQGLKEAHVNRRYDAMSCFELRTERQYLNYAVAIDREDAYRYDSVELTNDAFALGGVAGAGHVERTAGFIVGTLSGLNVGSAGTYDMGQLYFSRRNRAYVGRLLEEKGCAS